MSNPALYDLAKSGNTEARCQCVARIVSRLLPDANIPNHGYILDYDKPHTYTRLQSEWTDVIPQLQQLADEGDAGAKCNLGVVYAYGFGVSKNLTEAFRLFQEAAAGNLEAQCNLGLMYAEGDGVPQDYEQAFEMWNAAAQKCAFAKARLAWFYRYGRGLYLNKSKLIGLWPFIDQLDECRTLYEKLLAEDGNIEIDLFLSIVDKICEFRRRYEELLVEDCKLAGELFLRTDPGYQP
jgi:TPR repeat protein